MDIAEINRRIDQHIANGVTPPPHTVRAFHSHLPVDRQEKDLLVRAIMRKAPRELQVKAQWVAKQLGINGLGKGGMLELWFRLGVVLNEIEEGR